MIKIKKEDEYLIGYNENNVACCYYPLIKGAKELDLLLLPPFEEVDEFEQFKRFSEIYTDTVIELAIEIIEDSPYKSGELYERELFKRIKEKGYKVALSKFQYSLEDMKKAIEMAREYEFIQFGGGDTESKYTEEEIIQSLSTQRMPSKFIPELVIISNDEVYFDKQLKTITNSEGKQELVGTYKY